MNVSPYTWADRAARVVWPALLAALLGVPILNALLHRVPDAIESDLIPETAQWPAQPVDLPVSRSIDGTRHAHLALSLPRPETLLFRRHVRLLFATYETYPALVRAELNIDGTTCAYRTTRGAELANNSYLDFYSDPTCQKLTSPPTGRIDLLVVFRGHARVALWTYQLPVKAVSPAWISIQPEEDNAGSDHVSVIRGRYVEYRSLHTWRRVDLLGHVWQVSASAAWIWIVVGIALALVFVGSLLLAPAAGQVLSAPRGGTAVATVALGITVLYVVIIPPFQAPDEPDHFLSFAQVAGRADLADDAATLAKLGHLARIRFHGADRFRPADVGHPLNIAWGPEVFAEQVAARSATTYFWWTGLAPMFRRFGASETLLGLRLMNALLFAALLGIATAILIVVSRDVAPSPQSVPLALLMVPTAPFCVMYVSEFALLTSVYLCLSVVLVGLFLDGRRAYLLGLSLGLGMSLVFASGRSGLPFLGLLTAAVMGRCVLGHRSAEPAAGRDRQAFVFWIGLGLGLLVFEVLATPEFRNGLWPIEAADVAQLHNRVWVAADSVRRNPWLLILAAPLGFALEVGLRPVRRRLAGYAPASLRHLAYVAAALVVGSLLLSTVRRYPMLPTIEASPPASVGGYVRQVFSVVATGFRLQHHDLLLSRSFWGGFGWIDALLAESFVSMLVLLTAAALVLLLIHVARSGDLGRLTWLVVFACGWAVTLVLYAAASYYVHRNLMGRYLVGFYLSILGICWSITALIPPFAPSDPVVASAVRREWLLITAAAGVHAYTLQVILARYF